MNDAPPSSRDAVLDEIAGLLRELHARGEPVPAVRMDARLDRDLGLDSLSRMELLGRLERRLHATIPEQLAVEAQTAADLLRALARAPLQAAPAGDEGAVPPTEQDIRRRTPPARCRKCWHGTPCATRSGCTYASPAATSTAPG